MEVVETFWQVENQGLLLTRHTTQRARTLLDLFGLVSWPGAVMAVQELSVHSEWIQNKRVLVLGARVGIEAQAAAPCSARTRY
jgi:predicted nicotinamide N-methyase